MKLQKFYFLLCTVCFFYLDFTFCSQGHIEGLVVRLTPSQSDQSIQSLMTKMHQYPYLDDVSNGVVQTYLQDDGIGTISGNINMSEITDTLQFIWDLDMLVPMPSMDRSLNVCILARRSHRQDFRLQMRSLVSVAEVSDEVLIRNLSRRR